MATESLIPIEDEITQRKVALSNLGAQNNTFSSVFRLPNEILTDIFIRYARDSYRFAPRHHRCTWLYVSYVCRHWRNAALNSPTFWSYIANMPARWIEEQLTRSKGVPLKVYIVDVGQYRDLKSPLEKVLSHMERMQELTLRIPNFPSDFPILFFRAPLLQYLSINYKSSVISSNNSPMSFDHDTPALRVLYLTRYALSWHLLKLNQLTKLFLDSCVYQPQHTMEGVLTALGGMQELTDLFLVGSLPRSPEQSSHTTSNTLQKIGLPRLSYLEIHDFVSKIVVFLTSVNIPPHTEVMLQCNTKDEHRLADYTPLSSVLARRFDTTTGSAVSTRAIRSLIIHYDDYGLRSKLTRNPPEHDLEPSNNIPLQLYLCLLDNWTEHVIGDMCCSIPLTYVRSLHVIQPPTSLDFWDRILGHLRGLQYLKLSRGNMPPLASILSGNSTRRGSSNGVFAPALEALELNEMTFMAVADLLSLQAALSTRKDPPVHLKILNCLGYNEESCDDEHGVPHLTYPAIFFSY